MEWTLQRREKAILQDSGLKCGPQSKRWLAERHEGKAVCNALELMRSTRPAIDGNIFYFSSEMSGV
jgi:hypothetical protein